MKQQLIYKLLMVLLTALLLAGCQSNSNRQLLDDKKLKRADIHYQIGLDALYKNQLPKAFDELMKSEAIDPNRPEVLDALGYAWRLRGNLEKSESYYLRALRSGAGSSTYNNYGSLLLESKRYAEAKVQLEKALDDPRYRKQFIAYINLGDALMGLGQFDHAIDAYRQAGAFNPRQTLSRVKEADAYVSQKRYNYAQALYETLLRENSLNRSALEGFVKLLTLRNDKANARKYLIAFIEKTTSRLDRAWASDELEKLRQP